VVGEPGHAGLVWSFTGVSFDADADANSVVHSCTGADAVAEPRVEGRLVLAARAQPDSDSDSYSASQSRSAPAPS
jgi:hypothetical protein